MQAYFFLKIRRDFGASKEFKNLEIQEFNIEL